jgi:hypothetical protein
MSLTNRSTLLTTQKNKDLNYFAAEARNLANQLLIITTHILMPTLILPLYLDPCFPKSPLISNFRTNLVYIIYHFHSCHMPCPSYQPRCVYHEPPLYEIFYSPCISSLLGPNILLSIQFSDSLNRYSSLKLRDQVSHPYETINEIIDFCVLV